MGNEASHQGQFGERLDNDVTVCWTKVEGENPFAGIDGHCATSVGSKLFVFGGVSHTNDGENHESNDLLVFDLEGQSWLKVDVQGTVPAARSSATIASVGTKLYLFGGLSQDSGWFQDLHMFDTENNTWSPLEASGTAPSPRDKLASAVIGNKVYFFGGFGPQEIEDVEDLGVIEEEESEDDEEHLPEAADQEGIQFGWFNDLHIFDTETKAWSCPMMMNLAVPTPRAAHGMCSIDKYLIIIGGRDIEGRKKDLHIFNTETRKWETNFEVKGRQPEPRSFHAVAAVGQRVVVMGGRSASDEHFSDLHIFDVLSKEWLQPTVTGDAPIGRGVHTLTVVGDSLVTYGGSSDFNRETMQCQTYHSDTYMLKTADVMLGGAIPKPATENQENVASRANVDLCTAEGFSKKKEMTNGHEAEISH